MDLALVVYFLVSFVPFGVAGRMIARPRARARPGSIVARSHARARRVGQGILLAWGATLVGMVSVLSPGLDFVRIVAIAAVLVASAIVVPLALRDIEAWLQCLGARRGAARDFGIGDDSVSVIALPTGAAPYRISAIPLVVVAESGDRRVARGAIAMNVAQGSFGIVFVVAALSVLTLTRG